MRLLVSSGFRGATRLAAGDPAMIGGFLHANAAEAGRAVDELIEELHTLRRALSGPAADLARALAARPRGEGGGRVTKSRVAAPLRGTRSRSAGQIDLAPGGDPGGVRRRDTVVRGYSPAGDCRATLHALAALGVEVGEDGQSLVVRGLGTRLPAADRPGRLRAGRGRRCACSPARSPAYPVRVDAHRRRTAAAAVRWNGSPSRCG